MILSISTLASLAADSATALGILFVVYQLHTAAKQRKKETREVVWDLLAADDVFMARMHIQTCDVPNNFEAVNTAHPEWFQAASRCFLAHQKAAQLVLQHGWMDPREFAEQWGFSTILIWTKLEPWILEYRTAHAYPGFGKSLEDLVGIVRKFQKEKSFRDAHYVAPDGVVNSQERASDTTPDAAAVLEGTLLGIPIQVSPVTAPAADP